jgi:5'(3')-deoxyribonucleotidase
VIVTSPLLDYEGGGGRLDSLFWVHERLQWLKRHFGFEPHEIVFTSQKHLIRGDVLVDDHQEHVEKFPGRGVLWAKPHNLQSQHPERHCSWEAI